MATNAPLCAAVDSVYSVFARYPTPSRLDASPLRDAAAILKGLTGAPLRDLPGEVIGSYSGWAMTSVGGVRDYKHFLPRILQLATEGGSWLGTQPEVIAQKLAAADWHSWPEIEQRSVSTVFALSWLSACRLHPAVADPSDWLCGLALLNFDIEPYLAAWLSPPSAGAVLQVASFLATQAATAVTVSDESGFWQDIDERARRTLHEWLLSKAVASALSEADVGVEDYWLLENGRAALEAIRGRAAPA